MGLHKHLQIALLAASAATAQVQQPQGVSDPTNPTNQNQNITPTLLNHGAGIDEGNVGTFPTPTDKQFVQLTGYRAMMEIQLGQMALQKASSPGVKALAQRTVEDYTKWQRGLQRVAGRLEISMPTTLDKKRQATLDRLTALTGDEFDQAYVKEMVHMQNRALTVTQNEATNAGITGFRNWAGLMMPTLEEHLKLTKLALPTSVAAK